MCISDFFLILLLALCTAGNYAWLMHVDGGWGSSNALLMFQLSFWFNSFALVVTVFRRFMYPELVPKGDDDDDDDDSDDDGANSEGGVGGKSRSKRTKDTSLLLEAAKVYVGEGRDRRVTTIGDVKRKDASVSELAGTFLSGLSGATYLKKRLNPKKKEH